MKKYVLFALIVVVICAAVWAFQDKLPKIGKPGREPGTTATGGGTGKIDDTIAAVDGDPELSPTTETVEPGAVTSAKQKQPKTKNPVPVNVSQ